MPGPDPVPVVLPHCQSRGTRAAADASRSARLIRTARFIDHARFTGKPACLEEAAPGSCGRSVRITPAAGKFPTTAVLTGDANHAYSTCCLRPHSNPVTASTVWVAMWKTIGVRVDHTSRHSVVHLPVARIPSRPTRYPHPDSPADLGKQLLSTGSTGHMTTMTEFFRFNEENPKTAAGDCGHAAGYPARIVDRALQQDVWHTRPGGRAGTRPGGKR